MNGFSRRDQRHCPSGKTVQGQTNRKPKELYLRISKETIRTRITIPVSVKTAIVKTCGPAEKKK